MLTKSFITKIIAISFILSVMLVSGIFLLIYAAPAEVNEYSEITTETERQIHPPLEFLTCSDDVEQGEEIVYDILSDVFIKEFPDLELAKVGSYCRFTNESKLITYSYYEDDFLENIVIYFNNVFGIIEYTNDFDCGELGINSYPIIQSIDENIVTLTCTLSSADEIYTETYHLYLPDLEIELDKIETEEV